LLNLASDSITLIEFQNAISKAGYPKPSEEQYNNFHSQLKTKGNIQTKREAAMFLSQILWESDGLQAKAEYACKDSGCPGVYGTSIYTDQNYYGRGYIQLVIFFLFHFFKDLFNYEKNFKSSHGIITTKQQVRIYSAMIVSSKIPIK